MNFIEPGWLQQADAWFGAFAWMTACAALAVSYLVLRRAGRERQRIEGVQRDLRVFAEASTRVAETLDQLLIGEVEPRTASAPSRRYLLTKAREGIEQGEDPDAVAARLDLCDDEKRLLGFLHRSSAPRHVHVA